MFIRLIWLQMKKNGFSHIRRWFWVHLFLVVLTTLAVYIVVYKEIVQYSLIPFSITELGRAQQNMSPATLSGFKLRVLLLLSASLIGIIFFSIIWLRMATRHIHRPIHTIQQAVFRLAQGKLNETVAIESADEFGQIGSSINELAANLQELLLYIWKQTGQCVHSLERIQQHKSELPESERGSHVTDQHLHELTGAIECLREMAKSYVFYDVQLDGEKTLAIRQPGEKEPAENFQSRSEAAQISK